MSERLLKLRRPNEHPAWEEKNTFPCQNMCFLISFAERLLCESVISLKARVCYKPNEVNNSHPDSKMRICFMLPVSSNK